MSVKLSALIEEIDMMPESCDSYLDKETGECYFISEDDKFAITHDDREPPEWQKEHLEKIKPILAEDRDYDRYISLPLKYDFHEYAVMDRFIGTLPDSEMREALWSSIRGRGAFSRFKNNLRGLNLEDRWYAYRDAALKEFIINWCKRENIPYVDDAADNRGVK
ncbi:MAG: hypothetical protein GY757_26185 [bacterium]|nr:hypothetical protein [bacterium]